MPTYIRTRSEFAVNSFTAENQTAPSVSTFADGGFIVVWGTSDPTQDGDDSAIKAQLFDSAGRKVGTEFLVNSAANGAQFTPAVATLSNGNFVVTWVTNVSDDGTNGIKAQLFSRSGDPIGGEFKVNAAAGGSNFTANVTALANGGFVISWDDWSSGFDMKTQIFDAAGTRVGGEFTLNTNTSGAQEYGDIVGLAGGGFVATWRTTDSSADGSGQAVKAQIFSASGAKLGAEFLVNSHKVGDQYSPAVAALAGGGFVVTWYTSDIAQDGSGGAIKAQVFSATGTKVGGEFLVNSQTTDAQTDPVVTATPDGGFVIAWTSRHTAQDGSGTAIKAQAFDSSGAKVGGEILVNTLATGAQFLPDLATLADGRVIVSWASESGDIGGYAVRAQILGSEPAAPLPNSSPIIISNGGGTSASLTHDEMVTAVTRVVASDDGEPNNLRYSITGGPDAALFTINALTGALAFRQAPDHEAPLDEGQDNFYTVTVTASDGQLTGSQSIQIYVRHLNQVTIVSDGGWDWAEVWADENQTSVTIVSAVDNDGLPLTYSITGGRDAAFFTIDAQTGQLSFNIAPDYEFPEDMYRENAYLVTVTVTDGTVSDSQQIMVYVNDVVEPEGFGIVSDGAGDYAEIGVDENGTAVTIVATQGAVGEVTYEIVGGYDASSFTIDPSTGQLSFIDAPDYEQGGYYYGHGNSYHVIVRASDGVSSDEQELYVYVQDVDEAPVFRSYGGQPNVREWAFENDPTAAFVVGAEDPDRYSMVTYGIEGGADADLFEVDPYSGELRFKTAPDHERPPDADGDNVYEVTVAAYSGMLSATQSFSIRVEDQFERVDITSDGGGRDAKLAVAENGTSVTVIAASGDNFITYEIVGGRDASFFVIDPYSGELRFAVAPDYEAKMDSNRDNVYEVTVRAGNGSTYDHQHVFVELKNVNEGVYITSGRTFSVAENATAATVVKAIDLDGGPITYAIAGGADAARFTIDSATGALAFVAAPDFEAPGDAGSNNVYDVVVSASDGTFTDTSALAVRVFNVNEGVTITSNGGGAGAAIAVAENGTGVTTVAAVDADGGAVTYAIAGGADSARFTIDASTGALAFVTAPDFEAPSDADGDNVYDVIVSAGDGSFTDSQALAVTVGNVDEGVTINSNGGGASATVAVAENGTAVLTVSASDADGGPVTYAIAGGADAARFRIDAATGALVFVSAPDFELPADAGGDNVYDVVVSASDGAFTATQAIAVQVGNVNEAPVITSNGGGSGAFLTVAENGTAVTLVRAVDPDETAATYSIVGGADAARFTIDPQTGALQFIAAPDFEMPADADGDNVYAVIVRAGDGQYWDEQVLSVSVTNVRDGNNVTGTSGNDSISGSSLNLALRTSNEEDIVYGRDGHDNIHGMAGDDDLYGEGGNDTLVGGAGADRLFGGLGKDQFTYNAVSDSTASAPDLILDFSRAQGDRISLSAIDANSLVSSNQAFTFIGSAAFSNVAGQLRYETSGGMTTVYGDVNGDGVADLQIQLSGTIALVASDFIL